MEDELLLLIIQIITYADCGGKQMPDEIDMITQPSGNMDCFFASFRVPYLQIPSPHLQFCC